MSSLVASSHPSKRSSLLRGLGMLSSVALLTGIPTIVMTQQPVQAQSATCQTVFLSNTLGGVNTFTNGQRFLSLVRRSSVQGRPAYEAFLDFRNSAGVFVTPTTLIQNQFSLQFRLRTSFGRVQQVPAAIICGPWRTV